MPIVTDPTKQALYAVNIASRDMEIDNYQSGVDAYEIVASTLPTENWPEDLKMFKGMSSADAAKYAPANKIEYVGQLLHRDQIATQLITEKLEQNKAKALRKAFYDQLPPDQADALVATAKKQLVDQINAQLNATKPA